MALATFSFDAETHTARYGAAIIPTVTQVIQDILPGWAAGEWYLRRGQAVHAACAYVAQGVECEVDPRIEGQVEACRRWFRDMGWYPELVECTVYSRLYQYAGTLDLLAIGDGKKVLVDYKAHLTETVPLQLAGYSQAVKETHGIAVNQGVGVQLNEDGTYRMSEQYVLRPYKHEFLSLRTAYGLRRRFKINENGREDDGE